MRTRPIALRDRHSALAAALWLLFALLGAATSVGAAKAFDVPIAGDVYMLLGLGCE